MSSFSKEINNDSSVFKKIIALLINFYYYNVIIEMFVSSIKMICPPDGLPWLSLITIDVVSIRNCLLCNIIICINIFQDLILYHTGFFWGVFKILFSKLINLPNVWLYIQTVMKKKESFCFMIPVQVIFDLYLFAL